MRFRQVLAVLTTVVARPDLWTTALRQGRMLARPRWWARAPFLPLPDADYLKFRLVTAYGGDGTATPVAADLVAYLVWCRAYPKVTAT